MASSNAWAVPSSGWAVPRWGWAVLPLRGNSSPLGLSTTNQASCTHNKSTRLHVDHNLSMYYSCVCFSTVLEASRAYRTTEETQSCMDVEKRNLISQPAKQDLPYADLLMCLLWECSSRWALFVSSVILVYDKYKRYLHCSNQMDSFDWFIRVWRWLMSKYNYHINQILHCVW